MKVTISALLAAACMTGCTLNESSETIQFSKANAASEHLREALYTPWIYIAGDQDHVNFESKLGAGMMPLYSMREPDRIREIFIDIKPKSGFYVFGGMSEEMLLERNEFLAKKGYVALVVIQDPAEGGYWANWVNRDAHDAYVGELSKLGISPGAIRLPIDTNEKE